MRPCRVGRHDTRRTGAAAPSLMRMCVRHWEGGECRAAALGGRTTGDPQQPRRPQCPSTRSSQPVPIVARIVWEHDGEEHIETEALG
jgi:hypothetical protein